jgi:hypothetical protein
VVEVLDTRQTHHAEWTFPSASRTVPAARAAVVERLAEWGLDGVRDTAALLVTEIVTNAVRHGCGGPVDLRLLGPGADRPGVDRPESAAPGTGAPGTAAPGTAAPGTGAPGTVRIEVGDQEPLPPRPHEVRPEDEGGRGLLLLTHCARAWGVRPGPRGKTVWFELAAPG